MSDNFCSNCGSPLAGKFCANCGSAAPGVSTPLPAPAGATTDPFGSQQTPATPPPAAPVVSPAGTPTPPGQPTPGAEPPATWAPWAYSLIIGISVAVGLLALLTTGATRTSISGLDMLLTIPTVAFYVIFGIWDARKVVKYAGGGTLIVPALLIPPVYVFMRQGRLKQSKAPAFVYLVLVLLYLLLVFASAGSSLGGLTGRLTCEDLVSESVRISDENAASLQAKLVSVTDTQVVTDNQGTKASGSHNTQLVCRGTGYYSDTQTAPTRMEYWTDSTGTGYIEYRAE